ncbi:MAG TPA: 2-oxoglutarate dehydrogenase E1 component, partial [Anaerolineales bacterium]
WLRKAAELGLFRAPQDPLDEVGLLRRLSQVEAFEGFLHRIFPGQTRFSIEGVDILVPMLDDLLGNAAGAGVCTAVIAMGHRGRLNVLTHILGKPYAAILAEFKDPIRHSSTRAEMGWTGDVKYHKGARRALQAGEDPSGEHVSMIIGLPPNPSHLEHIDPVAVGMARAAGSKVDQPGPPHFFADACLPILIHGDASFPGQGVVAETLNFSRLPGYRVGGAIHIITNNQLGYTAPPEQTRSTLYASDLAKGFQIPVIHTNADDPPACLEAVRTAFAYRQKFRKDFLIDLIGYRRYGHNEGDEPAFTQPQMYQEIERHPSVRKIWANALAERGQVSAQEADRWLQERMGELQAELEKLEPAKADFEPPLEPPPPGAARHVQTAVPLATLRELNADLLRTPQGFTLNRKLERPMQRRRSAFDDPAAPGVDWSTAEQLAFASILADGISIRLTGEDVERGTFSQRHAVFHDAANGQVFIPLQALPQARASFEVRNSALSEDAAIGFEFGYNIQAPQRLVVWEAQYGDFINVAQPMIDEFLLAARAKWEQTPSMVLLLPHAYEGQGPDHSSGRIERFLSLAAGTNLRLANCTTAAQYFHLLRRQAALLETDPLPLIVMTPKSLLRNPLVASPANGLAEGRWQPVIDDPGADPAQVHRLVLCSGKIYVDLAGSPQRADHPEVAIARLEQLYPFPADDLAPLFQRYPRLDEVVWAQEEPENMGAWPFIHPLLVTAINSRWPLEYVGRPANSSPAEGSAAWHAANQKALIARALKAEAAPQPVEAKSAARDSYYAKNKKS